MSSDNMFPLFFETIIVFGLAQAEQYYNGFDYKLVTFLVAVLI